MILVKKEDKMYYVKDHTGRNVDIDTLKVYNRCPSCGRETLVSDFWGLFADNNFSIFDTRINCDKCTQRLIRSGKVIHI
jgi:DNA-directed RNA polymerase subunit RPC12/RpoP